MKLKHHLIIAIVLIIAALFLTSVHSATTVAAIGVESESETSFWSLAVDNVFTSNATDETTQTLVGLGLPETLATSLVEDNGTGNSLLPGLLGIVAILATLTGVVGVVLLVVKNDFKKWLFYGSFGLL